MSNDVTVLRELAKQYWEVTQQPVMDQRRELWRRHNSLEKTRAPINVRMGYWNFWCKQMIDAQLVCTDPLYRLHERHLRVNLFHASLGDDFIFEPYIVVDAIYRHKGESVWGPPVPHVDAAEAHGSYKWQPPLKEPEDFSKLIEPSHDIDEAATAANLAKMQQAVGDIIPVVADRAPELRGCDIANPIAMLRGLDQIMYDMFDCPQWLHQVLAFMRDAILKTHQQAEDAGHWQSINNFNQAMSYGGGTVEPSQISPAPRKKLWTFMAAQEYTLISPDMHDEFLLRYQIPILEKFALCSYGCCEDLTNKIDMLRKVPNLRRIAVTPRADLAKSAGQIGRDYCISWRPNPVGSVCCGFDPERIRQTTEQGMQITRGQNVDIILKDVETVEGHLERLSQWVRITREVVEKHA